MPDDPTGGVVQNLFRLRQLENAVGDEAEALLRDLFDEIADAIQRAEVGGSGPPRTGKLTRLMDEVEELTGQRFEDVRELIASRATDIGLDQARFAGRQLDRALRGVTGVSVTSAREVVSRSQIESIVRSRPFEGKILRSWAKTEEQAVIHRVRRQVQLGMSQQETLGDIVRRVRGTQQGFIRQDPDTGQFVPKGTRGADVRPRFVGGVLNQTTRETEAIVRTAINHTATQGHLETYRANRDITKTYTYTAVLDSRTTQICMGLDGRTWAYDDPNRKEPPQHFNALPSGSRVWTRSGPVPIECVRVGDEVLTHEGRFRSVYAAMGKNHDSTIRDLRLSTGGCLRITDEHPVLTLNAGWKRADEVEAGDQVVQNREQATEVPVGVGSSEVTQSAVGAAHNRPSSFDEPPIPYSVFTSSAGVSASIQLQRQIMGEEREVDNVRADSALEPEVDPESIEDVDHGGFMPRRVPSVAVRQRAGLLPASIVVPHRVVGGHPLGVSFGETRRLLGLLGAPVVLSGELVGPSPVEGGGLRLPPDGNVMPVAGVVEGGFPEPEVAFDGADALLPVPVTAEDERSDSVGVRQVDSGHNSSRWIVATIISTADRPHQGKVWNLAVEGDETFTAEGVVVHNCRSILTPNVDWQGLGVEPPETGTRASADGQVPADTTYEDWLRDQDKSTQVEILGEDRANLFRANRIGLRDLVKGDNRRRTVGELRQLAGFD